MSDRLDMEHMKAEIKRLKAQIAVLEAESGESMEDTLMFMEQRENVGKFAGEVLAQSRSCIGDVCGVDIEEWALKYGLLETFRATEPCNPEHCVCAGVGEFPLDCHRYSLLGEAITKDL